MENVIEKIRALRKRQGVSQYRLALLSGVPRWAITQAENGYRPMSEERVKKLVEALEKRDEKMKDARS